MERERNMEREHKLTKQERIKLEKEIKQISIVQALFVAIPLAFLFILSIVSNFFPIVHTGFQLIILSIAILLVVFDINHITKKLGKELKMLREKLVQSTVKPVFNPWTNLY